MAITLPTIIMGHISGRFWPRSNHRWPKTAKIGHNWLFGHAHKALIITFLLNKEHGVQFVIIHLLILKPKRDM